MPNPTTRRLFFIAIIATALSANASDEVRIGRYATVVIDSRLVEIDTAPDSKAMMLPTNISSRADAARWILEQHGYQLNRVACVGLDLEGTLSKSLPARRNHPLPRSLRLALHAVLGPAVAVLVDPIARRVVLSMCDKQKVDPDASGNE